MTVELKQFTTFRLGGPCREWAECAREADVLGVLADWRAREIPWRVMGGGSNLLVADAGIPEAVLRLAADENSVTGIEVMREGGHVVVTVPSFIRLDALCALAVEEGWGGLEFASGIPGTIGGAVCGNAGAFGRQMGDCVTAVRLACANGNVVTWSNEDLKFDYRSSALQSCGGVILDVVLRLNTTTDLSTLATERESILAMRREKHPDWRREATAGSFFKNLPPEQPGGRRLSAGKLLEDIGAKSMREGGAYVY